MAGPRSIANQVLILRAEKTAWLAKNSSRPEIMSRKAVSFDERELSNNSPYGEKAGFTFASQSISISSRTS